MQIEVEFSTCERYIENINQLASSFGRMPVAAIGRQHVETWVPTRTCRQGHKKIVLIPFRKEFEVLLAK